ncbi:7c87b4b2-8ac1-42d9-9cae-3239c1c73b01 [Sclerotinia trifoliorum]|uniref:7c87b4b2-8ac1-42d9-9cae-3239c1c73b01 n=1 Tax=Sclerotinia trifoliorum TaxID=28548 RepID=A0A8H2VR04_9HELO|nr:7c87b4b2-8ac1-42d9-9cae-3239c1c73b01 [Sclerotinia trifoliorum]
MSAKLQSSNPFRRKAAFPSSTISPSSIPAVNHFAGSERPANPNTENAYSESQDGEKKRPKKVRLQSPPPSSPSIPDSTSTIGEDSGPFENPMRVPREYEQDPFDSITSDISEDEVEVEVKPPRARILNPFSKTLETIENPKRDALATTPANVTTPGRASMDVDAFKRLLMTGNAGLGPSTPLQSPPVHALRDEGSSSTDTSSLSRQSIFEPIQEPHPESPRSSHEISEPGELRRTISDSSSLHVKKKPPPPSSRHHGKLIKMELRDEPMAESPLSPPQEISATTQYFPIMTSTPNRSLTDLNKPLPPAPPRESGESERESPFDRESAGKAPEPPSPSSSIRRKAAPPPPVTRRHSQLVGDSKLSRSNSGRLSPRLEEDNVSVYSIEPGRPRSDSGKAPPPPPTRKHGLSRTQSHHVSSSPSATSLPIPPPKRGSSKQGRPPSVHSIEAPSPHISKRASMQGPPPPPRARQTRNSLDVSLITSSSSNGASGEYRRSSDGSSMSQTSRYEESSAATPTGVNTNILADLSALQQEIDALRNQSQQRQRSVT